MTFLSTPITVQVESLNFLMEVVANIQIFENPPSKFCPTLAEIKQDYIPYNKSLLW